MKELGFDQGVRLTRPWNPEMYEHNARVSESKKEQVRKALTAVYQSGDTDALHEVCKAICSYGFGSGYSRKDMYTETKNELDRMADWYMYEWCWPTLIRKGYVREIDMEFVGYKK